MSVETLAHVFNVSPDKHIFETVALLSELKVSPNLKHSNDNIKYIVLKESQILLLLFS